MKIINKILERDKKMIKYYILSVSILIVKLYNLRNQIHATHILMNKLPFKYAVCLLNFLGEYGVGKFTKRITCWGSKMKQNSSFCKWNFHCHYLIISRGKKWWEARGIEGVMEKRGADGEWGGIR